MKALMRKKGCFDASCDCCLSFKSFSSDRWVCFCHWYYHNQFYDTQMIIITTQSRLALNTKLKCIKHLFLSKYYHYLKLSGRTVVLSEILDTVSCFILFYFIHSVNLISFSVHVVLSSFFFFLDIYYGNNITLFSVFVFTMVIL